MFGYACYTERFAGDLAGCRQASRPPRGPRGHLPAPDAAAAARARATTTAGTPCRTTAPSAADLGTMDDLRDLASTLRERGISLVRRPGAQPRRPRARVGGQGARRAGRASRYRDYFHVFPDRDGARRLRADAAGGLPRLRARAASPGTTSSTAGSGRRSTSGSGTSTGPTRGAGRVRRHHPRPGQPRRRGAAARRDRLPLEAARHQLPEPARGARDHPGAAGGRPDRRARGRLQGRGDRRPARPRAVPRHRQPRRPGQRPRLPQQPDGAGLVDARRRRHRAGPAGARPALPADADHRHLDHLRPLPRRHRLGDRRRGRRRRRRSTATGTGASSPTGTPGSSRARGPTGWSSSTTRRPATAGSAAPRPRGWPDVRGVGPRTRTTALARLFLAHAVVAGWGGVPVVWSGDELGPAQRPRLGRASRATRTTTAGRTARASTPGRSRSATTCAPVPAGSSPASPTSRGCAPRCPSCTPRRRAEVLPDTDDGVLAVVRRHASGTVRRPLQRHRSRPARSRCTGCTTPG